MEKDKENEKGIIGIDLRTSSFRELLNDGVDTILTKYGEVIGDCAKELHKSIQKKIDKYTQMHKKKGFFSSLPNDLNVQEQEQQYFSPVHNAQDEKIYEPSLREHRNRSISSKGLTIIMKYIKQEIMKKYANVNLKAVIAVPFHFSQSQKQVFVNTILCLCVCVYVMID
ncbi:hypothetical protein RFI_32767 [Reticulomyxa filosa]|uniref:Uncharacterized protein n=1 Tax=Reticulomyxa filosa TaxID=46433 RepID=X6LV75_RETFI|nr:hypothetical protein RFI_32767 [Reticulomyxa filosa]|eukprot:ETO04630.1 hypothetical protein RFI_32767 [Reticulomyxa filosa]